MIVRIQTPTTFAAWSDALLVAELSSLRTAPANLDRDRMAYALWAARLAELAQARGVQA